jgi:hypothetical protein
MSTIVTRYGKGSPLTWLEVDDNFTNLNTDKIQSGNTVASLTITSATINGGTITGITDLAVADGGTGLSSLTAGYIPFGAGTSAFGSSANLFWDSANNRLGIGTTSPTQRLSIYTGNVLLIGDGSGSSFITDRYQDTATGVFLPLRKARGSFASPTATNSGDQSGTIQFQSYGGSNFRNIATIFSGVDTYTSDTNISGYLTFNTNSGATTVTERMRITSDGNVGIGTSSPSVKLEVNVSGTTGNGINCGDFTSAAQSTIPSIQSLGSRVDANATFQGRFGASLRRADGTAIASTTALGMYAFGGQWGTDTSYQSAKLLYPASIKGVAEGSFTSATAMPTAITFNTGSTGDVLGSVNLTYGTERMRIDSAGNVGIGTGSPTSKLTVTQGTAGATSVVFNGVASRYTIDFNGGGASYFDQASLVFRKFDATACGSLETATNTVLNLVSSTGYSLLTLNTASGNTSYLDFAANSVATSRITGSVSNGLTFATGSSNTERMRIDSSGNVTVGTTATTYNYQTKNIALYDGASSGISVASGTKILTFATQSSGGCFIGTRSNDELKFTTNDTERMRIATNGYVGIGTTNTSNPLVVRNDTTSVELGVFENTASSGFPKGILSAIGNNGNNTSSFHFAGLTQGVSFWYLYGNGTSSWTSDERKKKNIETTRNGYIDDLCKLRVVKYNWKTDEEDKPKELGLIAQEVEQIFPGLIQDALHEDIDGITYKTIKGSVLPYMLLKAIQEQQTIINDLTARITTLEGK